MPSILPITPSNPFYEFSTPVDGVAYWFRFRWNSRLELWHMDVLEEDKTPIITGVTIVLGAYLGRASVHKLFMNNIFVARAPKKDFREAGFDDFGARVLLYVFSRDEAVAEILGAVGADVRSGDVVE